MSGRDRELLRQIRADRWIDEAREEAAEEAQKNKKERERVRDDISAGSADSQAPSISDGRATASHQEYLSSVRRKSTGVQTPRPTPKKLPSGTDRNNGSGFGGVVALMIISAFLWFCGVTIYKVFAYSDVQGALDKASLVIECAMSPTCTQIPQSKH